jgi:GGDEF domain-containing protein
MLLPIILITGFTGGKFDLSLILAEFGIGVGVIYCITVGFYLILCRSGKTKAAIAVALVTDGVLLIFFSSAFGSGMAFNFLGFLIVIIGIVIGMSVATPSGESLFARKIDLIIPSSMSSDDLRKILDSIQFPCVFMERGNDGGERIIAYNQPFADNFNPERENILGRSLDDLLPVEFGKSQVNVGGEEWVIKRTVRGKQILVMLSPAMRSKEASKIEVFDSIDASTGLYAAGFMKYKAKADIESANRGKRRMSAALFRLTFMPNAGIGVNEEERKLASVIMGRVVQQSIRVCDSAYRVSDDEVLLLMPDTAESGSKVVISRIYALMKRMSVVECPSLSKGLVDSVDRNYIGGTDLPAYDQILGELSTLLYRKHPDLAQDTSSFSGD